MGLVGRVLRGATLVSVATGVMVASGVMARAQQQPSAFMRVYGTVQPPYGFVLFCDAMPYECVDGKGGDQRVPATPERLAELDAVNRAVNKAIEPATDMEIYGVSEHWTIPKTRGDCEDYALLKRRVLIERGWPIGSLLMTVVRDEKGEGHAILTARTTQGDFILDNKVDELKIWHKTPYDFVMRQSYLNARTWMSLDQRNSNLPSAMAEIRSPAEAAITRLSQ